MAIIKWAIDINKKVMRLDDIPMKSENIWNDAPNIGPITVATPATISKVAMYDCELFGNSLGTKA